MLFKTISAETEGGKKKQKGFLGFRSCLCCYSNVSSADARVYNEEVLRPCAVSLNVSDLAV